MKITRSTRCISFRIVFYVLKGLMYFILCDKKPLLGSEVSKQSLSQHSQDFLTEKFENTFQKDNYIYIKLI